MELLGTVGLGISVFAATNVDDIFVLMLFFTYRAYRPPQVVLGQYLGIAVLVTVSVFGAAVALTIPDDYIGLLGIVPILLGLRKLWHLRAGGDDPPDPDRREKAAAGGSQVLAVAAVTAANGGDNISIYVPLFASVGAARIAVMVAVFALMVAVWCGVAFWLVHRSAAGTRIQRYGHVILPFMLITLGVYILVSHTTIF